MKQPHEQRLFQEFFELGSKIAKLTGFMSGDGIFLIDARQQELMSRQLDAMNSYHYYLNERIKLFENENSSIK